MKKLVFLSLFLGVSWAEMAIDSASSTSVDSHSSADLPIDSPTNAIFFPPPPIDSPNQSTLTLLYNIRFDFLLDNTEDCEWLWIPRTISAVSLEPEIGLGIGENNALWVGGYGIQNMGAKPIVKGAKGGIYAYYAFSHSGFSAFLGISPRKKLILRYPRTFFRDDFEFMNPNINGVIFQYQNTQNHAIKGQSELVLNHFGGNLANATDMFYASLGGRMVLFDSVIFGANAILYHIQDTNLLQNSEANKGVTLLDNVLYSANIAWDLRGFEAVSEIFEVVNIGFTLLGGAERKRGINDRFRNALGYEVSANLQYKGFGIEESHYFGKPQMRYFSEYGLDIYNGLPFYQTNFNRINAYYAYQNDFMQIRFNLIFFVIGKKVATQQMLNFSFDMGKLWR